MIMIMRYLAGIWSVLRVIPSSFICSFGGLTLAFLAITISPSAALFSIPLTLWGGWRSFRRQYVLSTWRAWTP